MRSAPLDHRAQLVELERDAVAADAALAVDRRARGVSSRIATIGHARAAGARRSERDAADEHVERPLAPRRQVAAHRVPSGASQPASVPWRSQS